MTEAQRARMIARFHERKMASPRDSLEHKLCGCVVLALLYGGSVRTVNRVARRERASWQSPSITARGYQIHAYGRDKIRGLG